MPSKCINSSSTCMFLTPHLQPQSSSQRVTRKGRKKDGKEGRRGEMRERRGRGRGRTEGKCDAPQACVAKSRGRFYTTGGKG